MLQKLLCVLGVVVFACSCSSSDDPNSVASQQERILTYLESNHSDEYRISDGVYVVDALEEPITEGQRLEVGDSAEVYFAIYQFSTKIDSLANTNIQELAEDEELDSTFLSFEPMKIKYGTTPLINGINSGLNGMVEGNSCFVFMTSEYGYGESITATIPGNNALMVFLDVVKIKKN